jgi:gliding motility-associated protein GldM
MQGSEYEAQVFTAAIDTTQAPVITIGSVKTTTNADGSLKYEMAGDYQTLPLDETGKGIYKARASSVGQKPWGGLITMTAPDGTPVSYKFDAVYSVGESNVVISPTAMNVLYRAIPNPIDISVPGVGADKIRVTMKNGTISKGQVKNPKGEPFPGTWVAEPLADAQTAQILVTAEINGKQTPLAPREFRVRDIPPPVGEFAGISGQGSTGKGTILAMQGVRAVLKDFDFDLLYTVTSFDITYEDKGLYQTKSSTTNMLTPEQKVLLNGLTRGKRLIIEKIKAKGPDKIEKSLGPIMITVN